MAFDLLKFLFICLEVILLFNLLILVHELGHFLAARWRGLVVEKKFVKLPPCGAYASAALEKQ